MKVIDVTVPLQCLVKDSKLLLTEASKVRTARLCHCQLALARRRELWGPEENNRSASCHQ